MISKNYCKEIFDILKILNPGTTIHTTNRGNSFHFIEFRDGKLFFSIPNHKTPQNPNIKSITEVQFCILLEILIKNKTLIKEDFPFQDCRKAAFYGFVNQILISKLKYIKT